MFHRYLSPRFYLLTAVTFIFILLDHSTKIIISGIVIWNGLKAFPDLQMGILFLGKALIYHQTHQTAVNQAVPITLGG